MNKERSKHVYIRTKKVPRKQEEKMPVVIKQQSKPVEKPRLKPTVEKVAEPVKVEEVTPAKEEPLVPSVIVEETVIAVVPKPVAPLTERGKLRETLFKKFMDALEVRHKIEVTAVFKNHKSTVKRRDLGDESGIDQFIIEKEVLGVHPAQFMRHYGDMVKSIKGSTLCKRVDILHQEKDEHGEVDIYASHIKSPTRLISGRIFVDAKYMWHDKNIVIMSSHGNSHYKDQYLGRSDLDGFTLAFCNITGLLFTPMVDPSDSQKVIGTNMVFVSESDFGGNVPKWITQKFAPSSLSEFCEEAAVNARSISLE